MKTTIKTDLTSSPLDYLRVTYSDLYTRDEYNSKPPPTELLAEKANEVATIGMPSLCYSIDYHGTLVHTAPLDNTVQSVGPSSSRPRILYLSHYSKLARHTKVGDYCHCSRNCTCLKRKRTLKLFPASSPLEFIVLDILRPLPRITSGNHFIIIITDMYTKLTRSI